MLLENVQAGTKALDAFIVEEASSCFPSALFFADSFVWRFIRVNKPLPESVWK